MKPLLYIPFGTIKDTSPFSITKNPSDIVNRGSFVFFDDESFHYAVEFEDPGPGKGGLDGISSLSPWPAEQIAGAKRVGSEADLKKVQYQATGM